MHRIIEELLKEYKKQLNIDESTFVYGNGKIVCPKGRKFNFKYEQHMKGNNYGRTEEVF